jgi:hypothetical protein
MSRVYRRSVRLIRKFALRANVAVREAWGTGDSEKRTLAVFTIVQDEPEFIHAWVNHYRKHVADARDIYVLVHTPVTSDGKPINPAEMPGWQRAEALLRTAHGVHVLPVHHASSFDHEWLRQTVFQFQSFLLQSYRWVLFAEVDEFVLPTPGAASAQKTLLNYVRELEAAAPLAIRATGFEIVQQDDEPSINQDKYSGGINVDLTPRDLIEARRWWRPSRKYSKTLLARTPLRWNRGFHSVRGVAEEIATDQPSETLTLIHLHKVDFELALSRRQRFRTRTWSQVDIENRWGWHNRIDSAAELRAFWKMDVDTNRLAEPDRLQPITDGIKEALGGLERTGEQGEC